MALGRNPETPEGAISSRITVWEPGAHRLCLSFAVDSFLPEMIHKDKVEC
jgi:hypothetical protein